MSKVVLGQTMTDENGGSLAQAMVHNQIRIDILQDDARQLANTINRDLIAPFVALNFGPTPRRRGRHSPSPSRRTWPRSPMRSR